MTDGYLTFDTFQYPGKGFTDGVYGNRALDVGMDIDIDGGIARNREQKILDGYIIYYNGIGFQGG